MVTKEQRVLLDGLMQAYCKNAHHSLRLSLQMNTIDDVEGLVSGYIPLIEHNGRIFRLWCRPEIERANISVDDLVKPYKRPYPHQRWMKETTRRKIARRLTDEKVLEKQYADFDELYDELLRLKITTGELFRYDLALRIGHCMGLLPKGSVYLQEGALKGAQILHDKGLIALPEEWKHRVERTVFDDVFPDLDAMDIENILCVHKADFQEL